MPRVHLLISGKVQGVSFRSSSCQEAQRLGLVGRVKNLPNGKVEAIAEGSKGKLASFVAWCQHGPVNAQVSEVKVQWPRETGEFSSFEIES